MLLKVEIAGRIPVASTGVDPGDGGEDDLALERFEPWAQHACQASVAARSLLAEDSGCSHGDLRVAKATESMFETLAGSIVRRIVDLGARSVGSWSRHSRARANDGHSLTGSGKSRR